MARKLLMMLAGLAVATPALAIQVVLTSANVIGTSGAYSATYAAGNIFGQQTGTVTDNVGQYWVAQDSFAIARYYITIDLGAEYQIESLDLFNTHNSTNNDRGTGNFAIYASNSVTAVSASNFQLAGTVTQLVSGTLAPATGNPAAQTFAVASVGTFRYLSFEPLSVAAPGTPFTSRAYGLNELRVFATAVPEPGTAAAMMAGLGVVLLAKRRRQSQVI